MPPIVIQMPESSPWASLLPALIGVFGAILGVAVTSWATRRREREHRVWERRCDLHVAVITQTRVVDKIIESGGERAELTFEDPAKFAELSLFCSVALANAVRYFQLEYREWVESNDRFGAKELRRLGLELRAQASRDLGIKRATLKDQADRFWTLWIFRVTRSGPAKWMRRVTRPWRERRAIERQLRER